MHFGENLDASIKYANTAFKGFGGWFVLILLNTLMFAGAVMALVGAAFMLIGLFTQVYDVAGIDPQSWVLALGVGGLCLGIGTLIALVLSIFLVGIQIRAFRGGELNFANFGQLIRDGFLGMLIACVYLIPYTLIAVLAALGPVTNPVYYIIVCIIIPTLLLIVSLLIEMTAMVHFAKKGTFSSAFQIKEICSIISAIGWLRYIGYLCLLALIIGAVECVLAMIPFVGLLLLPVLLGFIQIAQARFIGNLYETAFE
jgi:hypothetical protein